MSQNYTEMLAKFRRDYLGDEPRWQQLLTIIEMYLAQCRVITYEKTGSIFYYHILPIFNFERQDYPQIIKHFKNYKKLSYVAIDNRSGRRSYVIRFSDDEHLFIQLAPQLYKEYLMDTKDRINTFYKNRSPKFTPLMFCIDLDNVDKKTIAW